ncbi:MAG: glycosyltransferase family 25 protein [Flavobacteriaceae bacterium]|nr:glycosyltransferase family 25 protein [Flavobacteriaceae bacterium]MCY4253892.1 glycosyltransferase family 25 protein [Flavobacteriaceae bacterium]
MSCLSHKIFVINLNTSKDRWKRIKEQLDLQKLDYERISGIDLREDSRQHLKKRYNPKKNRKKYHKSLSIGEIGCYLSHIKCWKKILSDKIDFAVIIEDDVKLLKNLNEILLTLYNQSFPNWDYIKIGEKPIKRKTRVVKGLNDFRLIKYLKKPPTGSYGQIVSKTGAKKLLDNSKTIFRPVDVDIQYVWENKLILYGIKPYCVDPIKTQSDISDMDSKKNHRSRPLIRLLNSIKENWHQIIQV